MQCEFSDSNLAIKMKYWQRDLLSYFRETRGQKEEYDSRNRRARLSITAFAHERHEKLGDWIEDGHELKRKYDSVRIILCAKDSKTYILADPDRSKTTKIKLQRCRSTRVGAIMREKDDSTVSGRLSNFLQCGFVRRRRSRWEKTSLSEHEEILD